MGTLGKLTGESWMNDQQQSSRSNRFRNAIALTIVVGGLCVLVFLVLQVIGRQAILRAAPTDNIQWSMSQLQIELLMLEDTTHHAIHDDGATLADIRRRFDIFYSRINTLEHGRAFELLKQDEKVLGALRGVRKSLDEITPLLDGSDQILETALPQLEKHFESMLPVVRQLSLDGIAVFARKSDADRAEFSRLLLNSALLALAMIGALVGLLVVLVFQSREARKRSGELAAGNRRYASMVNASLDAIIVSDAAGRVVDFNPAAERAFGYSRNAAIGQRMDELIIPPKYRDAHRAGMDRYLKTGEAKALNAGRLELGAMRSGGEEFPVELSLGVASGAEAPIFIGYIRDISDRVQTQEELTTTRDLALAAAKAKSEFLAVMSHEMRTPLNGVMGILDLLSDTKLTGQQKHYLQTAVTSGEILQQHISDVLDITRIEEGLLKLKSESFDLEALVREVVEINEPAAKHRGNRIEIALDLETTTVAQDRNRLRQILLNLVGNAIKFTMKGTVRVEVSQHNGGSHAELIEIAVADTGIGIGEEDRARIFDDFVMLDPSYQRAAQGTGLGLAISRRIVEAMDGEIGVTSKIGEGSRFWLRVPMLATKPVAIEPAGPAQQQTVVADVAVGLQVLLVEDNETNRFVAREMLRKMGCSVTEAVDGIEGVEQADTGDFDLILMDISMPGLDGVSATRQIRAGNGRSKDTTIIGLTAHAMPREQEELREAGMQDCLIKPLRDKALRKLLADYTKQATRPASGSAEKELAVHEALDASTIGELVDLLPPGTLKQRLETFNEELLEMQDRFGKPNGEQADDIGPTAHRYAGSAAVFGAMNLRRALLRLEEAANTDARTNLKRQFEAVKNQAAITQTAVADLLHTL